MARNWDRSGSYESFSLRRAGLSREEKLCVTEHFEVRGGSYLQGLKHSNECNPIIEDPYDKRRRLEEDSFCGNTTLVSQARKPDDYDRGRGVEEKEYIHPDNYRSVPSNLDSKTNFGDRSYPSDELRKVNYSQERVLGPKRCFKEHSPPNQEYENRNFRRHYISDLDVNRDLYSSKDTDSLQCHYFVSNFDKNLYSSPDAVASRVCNSDSRISRRPYSPKDAAVSSDYYYNQKLNKSLCSSRDDFSLSPNENVQKADNVFLSSSVENPQRDDYNRLLHNQWDRSRQSDDYRKSKNYDQFSQSSMGKYNVNITRSYGSVHDDLKTAVVRDGDPYRRSSRTPPLSSIKDSFHNYNLPMSQALENIKKHEIDYDEFDIVSFRGSIKDGCSKPDCYDDSRIVSNRPKEFIAHEKYYDNVSVNYKATKSSELSKQCDKFSIRNDKTELFIDSKKYKCFDRDNNDNPMSSFDWESYKKGDGRNDCVRSRGFVDSETSGEDPRNKDFRSSGISTQFTDFAVTINYKSTGTVGRNSLIRCKDHEIHEKSYQSMAGTYNRPLSSCESGNGRVISSDYINRQGSYKEENQFRDYSGLASEMVPEKDGYVKFKKQRDAHPLRNSFESSKYKSTSKDDNDDRDYYDRPIMDTNKSTLFQRNDSFTDGIRNPGNHSSYQLQKSRFDKLPNTNYQKDILGQHSSGYSNKFSGELHKSRFNQPTNFYNQKDVDPGQHTSSNSNRFSGELQKRCFDQPPNFINLKGIPGQPSSDHKMSSCSQPQKNRFDQVPYFNSQKVVPDQHSSDYSNKFSGELQKSCFARSPNSSNQKNIVTGQPSSDHSKNSSQPQKSLFSHPPNFINEKDVRVPSKSISDNGENIVMPWYCLGRNNTNPSNSCNSHGTKNLSNSERRDPVKMKGKDHHKSESIGGGNGPNIEDDLKFPADKPEQKFQINPPRESLGLFVKQKQICSTLPVFENKLLPENENQSDENDNDILESDLSDENDNDIPESDVCDKVLQDTIQLGSFSYQDTVIQLDPWIQADVVTYEEVLTKNLKLYEESLPDSGKLSLEKVKNIMGPCGKDLVVLWQLNENPIETIARTKSKMGKKHSLLSKYDPLKSKWVSKIIMNRVELSLATGPNKADARKNAGTLAVNRLRSHYYTLMVKADYYPKDKVIDCEGNLVPAIKRRSVYQRFRHSDFSNIPKVKKVIDEYVRSDSVNDLVFSFQFPLQDRKELQAYAKDVHKLHIRTMGPRKWRFLVISKIIDVWTIIESLVNNDPKFNGNYKLLPPTYKKF